MPDNDKSIHQVPEAKTVPKKRTRLSFVWIIPIVAALAGVWIAVTRIMSQGPEITIEFQSAEGLEAGKTKVNFNGLAVGKLTEIHLAEDHKTVIAKAQMDPKSKEFLVKDTKFWVVKPRVEGLSISGLGTLISGHYIGVEIGHSRESERHFVAMEEPPMVSEDTPGRYFMLKTPELGSISKGAPIYYRRLRAGQVVSYALDKDGQLLNVQVFVESPYEKYVTTDTRFWHASGIDMSISASGMKLQTESLMSILAGGIAFETPASDAPKPVANANAAFTLYDNHDDAFKPLPSHPRDYLLVFKQSVRGLEVGAPVIMSGITVGEVTRISAQIDQKTMEFSVPVTISVDPERYGVNLIKISPDKDADAVQRKVMDSLVSHGLRVQLKKGSLISGALYVSADFLPDPAPATIDWSQNPPELPTLSSSIEDIELGVASIVKKLDQMEFKEISDDLRKTFGELDKTLATTRGTLTNADLLLGNAGQMIGPDSVLDAQLGSMLEEVGGAARAMRVLADYLERHPEALIRGKKGEAKP